MEPLKLELVASLPGHQDRVWSVAWSPKGDMLASCSGDKTVRIWTRRPTARPAPPASVAADACQDEAAAQPQQQQQQQQQQQWYCSAILDQCHTRTIRAVAWSPSGRSLATASFDATVAIWELSGGVWEQVAELEGHENEVKCVAWNPDGRLIATCGRDRSVWIWESMPGREFECVDVKQGHSQDVKVVRWHPSGELLVSAGYDDTVRLWTYDGDEWGCSQTLGGSGHGPGHTSTVWDVAWDPDGQRLASCSDDLTVRIWESRAAIAAATAAAGTPPPAPAAPASASAPDGVTGGGGSGGCLVPSRPNLRCGATLSGYHTRTVFSLDWGPAGLLATGDGEDSICVFGQGDPELAALALGRWEREQQAQQPEAGAQTQSQSQSQASRRPDKAQDDAAMEDVGASVAAASDDDDDEKGQWGALAAAGQKAGPRGGAGEGSGALRLSQAGGGPWGQWAVVRGAHDADVNCVRWSPTEPRLVASCSDDGVIKLWWLQAP